MRCLLLYLVLAPRLVMRYYKEQIFFAKKEVKKNNIHTCKLLEIWDFIK